nr:MULTISPECIES: hypothetical protein [unclassified Sphingopyxis]
MPNEALQQTDRLVGDDAFELVQNQDQRPALIVSPREVLEDSFAGRRCGRSCPSRAAQRCGEIGAEPVSGIVRAVEREPRNINPGLVQRPMPLRQKNGLSGPGWAFDKRQLGEFIGAAEA